jgi:hypothetical protein
MAKKSALKKGSILSETSFYVVKEVLPAHIVVTDEHNNEVTIGKEYVEGVLQSADDYDVTEKKTMTELAEVFINSPRIAMTVAFYKKDVEKTKKAYEAEKTAKVNEITNAKVSDVPKLLNDLIENPISRTTPGELRVMKGRHFGVMDDLGRVKFVDMELPLNDPAGRIRQVDPRTIEYIICNNVKYVKK